MHNKLTLRIENNIIKSAKKYAKLHNKSLSQLISDYLMLITEADSSEKKCRQPYPLPNH